MNRSETSAEIDAIASEWAVRIDHAPLTDLEHAELEQWVGDDVRRRGALARAQAMLSHAHRAKALGLDFDPDGYVSANAPPEGPSAQQTDDVVLGRRKFLRWSLSAAAAGATGLIGGALLMTGERAEAYSTQRGELRLVPLPDGSTMTLNTATMARIWMAGSERRVELTHGEALFNVSKEGRRPFLVMADDVAIQGMGSSFVVRKISVDRLSVLIRQGVVGIKAGWDEAAQRFGANTFVTVRNNKIAKVTSLSPSDVTRELAWREGMLAFEDRPLYEIAKEFARYSDRHILFASPQIADETVTGLFTANDPINFAESAALSLGLKVDRVGKDIVLQR